MGQEGTRQTAITDGTLDPGHPSVALMLAMGSTSCSAPLTGAACTVTLVGQRTLLTAAHCIHPGETHIVCFDKVTTYKPQKLVQHFGWDSQSLANDIGVVILDQVPPGPPSVISRDAPSEGDKITLVGFGTTAETLKDAGTKRVAVNYIKDLWATRFSYVGTGGGIGNTCHGDSGGPAFSDAGSTLQVGVTSAGLKPCGSLGYSTRVDAYVAWLEQVSAGDLAAEDTQPPQVGITAPADGATLTQAQVQVQISASDDIGVASVELVVDGVSAGKLTAPPYAFTATLANGSRTLEAVARDAAGNQAKAQVTVTVSTSGSTPSLPPNPTPGLFGAKCDDNAACISQLCGTYDALTYCTQDCEPDGEPCPYGAECVSAGGDRHVCGPPATTYGLDGTDQLVGGCRLARGPGDGLLAVLVLLGLVLRRRWS